MRKPFSWSLIGIGAIGAVGLANPAFAQPNAVCTGTLAAGTYNNVSVPANATCTFASGVTVQGNVTVAAGASLIADSVFPTIDGSVLAANAAGVELLGATVEQNVVLTGTSGLVLVESVGIGGHLTVSYSTIGPVAIVFNTITGNVLVSSNTPTASFAGTPSPAVGGNTISGNLVCVGNTPAANNVVSGTPSPNTVAGNKVGECAGL
jgi:hypothetical protein